MGSRVVATVVVVCIAVLLGSCSGDDAEQAASRPRSTTTTTAAASANTGEMCKLFQDIAAEAQAAKTVPGSPDATFTSEQWQQKIETTAEIVTVVPAEHRAEAEVYLQLVKDRSVLAATYNYGVVPTAARQQFMADRGTQQVEANKLLAFVRATCNLPTLAQ